MIQKKRHGLWIFHHEARRARERFKDLSIRWWVDEELERCRRMMSVMWLGWGHVGQWSNADALAACAARYRRMYGGVRTVGEWNALIERISERSGYRHHTTLKSAKVHFMYRDKSPIFFRDGDVRGDRPFVKFLREEIEKRHRRMKLSSQQRQQERKEREERAWFVRYLQITKELSEAREAVSSINSAIKAAKAAMKEQA